jgi:hypothetical protein
MLISLAYRLTRKVLGAVATIARRDVSKDAELLVLRHENTVLRRQVARVRYKVRDRLWLAALSSLIPRRRWTEAFAVGPATLPALASQAGRREVHHGAASARTPVDRSGDQNLGDPDGHRQPGLGASARAG